MTAIGEWPGLDVDTTGGLASATGIGGAGLAVVDTKTLELVEEIPLLEREYYWGGLAVDPLTGSLYAGAQGASSSSREGRPTRNGLPVEKWSATGAHEGDQPGVPANHNIDFPLQPGVIDLIADAIPPGHVSHLFDATFALRNSAVRGWPPWGTGQFDGRLAQRFS